jgi:Beta-propeller repeat
MIVHLVVAEQRLVLVFSVLLFLLVSCGVQPDASAPSELKSLALSVSYTRQFGTVNRDDVAAIATDALGNTYLAVNTGFSFAPEVRDTAYILSYDPSGNLLRTWNPSSCCGFWNNHIYGVVTDAAGNVYIAGDYSDYHKTHYVFIEKYDPSGNVLWTRQFRDATTTPLGDPTLMRANALSIDARGNLYLLFQKSFYPYQTPGVYARKYSPQGGVAWERMIGSTFAASLPATLTAAANGNVYTAFVCGFGVNRVDSCLSKLDTRGNPLWSLTLPSNVYQFVRGLTTDASENLFIAGYTQGSLEGTNQGSYDAFIRKYDGNGNVIWTRQFGTTGSDVVNGIAAYPTGKVFVTGSTQGSLLSNFTNKGNDDAFIRQYDTNGNILQTRQLGTTLSDIGSSVTTDTSGNIFLGGSTNRSFQAGVTNKGGFDVYIRKYNP